MATEYVSKPLMAAIKSADTNNVDIRDPHWRVAPQGWFSDKELEPERKKLK